MNEVKKPKYYEEIVQILFDKIKNRELRPGDRLPPERKLAEDMGVSRTVIREALRSLETMGYIRQQIGNGTFIAVPTVSNLMDPFSAIIVQDVNANKELIEIRLILEPEIAKLAASNRTAGQLSLIQNNLDISRADVESGGFGIEQDYEFHKLIAEASGNSSLSKIFDMCAELLLRTQVITQRVSGQTLSTLNDHQAILNALREYDGEQARKLMRQHLIKAADNLQRSKM
ncbi:MAG: FadR/GntR family transcriptional regulator [Oscillospiraceae bacterium]